MKKLLVVLSLFFVLSSFSSKAATISVDPSYAGNAFSNYWTSGNVFYFVVNQGYTYDYWSKDVIWGTLSIYAKSKGTPLGGYSTAYEASYFSLVGTRTYSVDLSTLGTDFSMDIYAGNVNDNAILNVSYVQ